MFSVNFLRRALARLSSQEHPDGTITDSPGWVQALVLVVGLLAYAAVVIGLGR